MGGILIAGSTCAFAYNIVVFYLVKVTSSLTSVVLANVKTTLIIVIAVLLWDKAISNNKAGGAGAGEGDDEARRKLRTERRADIKTGRARAARWCFYGRMRVAPYRCSWRCTV